MLVFNDLADLLPTLNDDQQSAADGFFEFLFSDQKEMIISGPGGTGKTFLMGWLIDKVMSEYLKTCKMMGIESEYDEVVMTATTNKAAEVLGVATSRPTMTIHSFLNLKVSNNFETGGSDLTRTSNWIVHSRKVIFIDEAYMIDTQLLDLIHEGTFKCKIVYVGDHCQLAPVMEPISPIHRRNFPFFQLTKPVRNAGQTALIQVCRQLRDTVETGEFKPIQIVPGVIDYADDDEMQDLLAQTFTEQTREARILAFTNKRVVEYNDHIRSVRQLPEQYQVGELLVNNHMVTLGRVSIAVEEDVEIIERSSHTEEVFVSKYEDAAVTFEAYKVELRSSLGDRYRNVALPADREHFASLVRWYSQKKLWSSYFFLKKCFPDLRQRDAATVHKAQGSSYDTVFIDLGDISNCHQPKTAARLLYVAFTRARNRVVLYGQLAEKYGGLLRDV